MDHMRPSPIANRAGPGYGPPQTPAARRGPGPMLANSNATHHQPMSQAQFLQQQQQAMQERELAKRRARKPTDKTIPESVEELVPNVRRYRELREMERRYDAAILRKRCDIQEAVNRSFKNNKTLRIFVSNTAKDQPWQNADRPLDENAFDFDTGQIPTFRVRIEGRLLDDDDDLSELDPDCDLGLKNPSPPTPPPKRKFSSFFKSITVELERNKDIHPEGNIIEWRKQPINPAPPAPGAPPPPPPFEFDGFEFERKGDENITCTIKLVRDESPDRFRLSSALAQLLDTKEDTRAGIVMGIWEYVRVNGLQDMDERRTINCDAAMKSIFNCDRLYFPQIPDLTLSHIAPLEPITISYTIRTDVPSNFSPTVYDVTVAVEDPIRAKMQALVNSTFYAQSVREISVIDDQIALLVQAINHSKAKRDFWHAFSEDPAEFVKRWVASQKRDLDTISGEGMAASVEEEEKRRAAFYDKVGESVYMLLAKAQKNVVEQRV
ncbi:SWI/SNF and RSC complex subunit Ssr3 [Rhizina undulata]